MMSDITVLWFTLCVFCSLHLVNVTGEEVGICNREVMIVKTKYVIDRMTFKWKAQEYQEPKEVTECCEGFNATSTSPSLQCAPVCDPECVDGVCEAPNTCVCPPGHVITNNSSNTCYDICDSCVNSRCLDDDARECECYDGYEKDKTHVHVCNPVCSPSCVNATCSGPAECECFPGFQKDPHKEHICAPKCSEQCVFGRCTAPEECTCFDGYISDLRSPSLCVPICSKRCTNGFCDAPDSCKCFTGFQPHARDPFQCVPRSPQNSSLNFCELKVPKAVKYNKNQQCFVIRDKVTMKGDPKCKPLLEVLSQPSCSQHHRCPFSNQCLLNFLCSAKGVNGSKEVHCDLKNEDFEKEESGNVTISEDTWTDLVLVLNSFPVANSSSVSNDQSSVKDWIISPRNIGPVCGQKHFGIEICNSDCFKVEASKLNSSRLSWIGSFLFVVFLIFIIVGGGWFFWARHRRLNDPLNYRENMLRGFSNQGYVEQDTRPEFLTMDESEDGRL